MKHENLRRLRKSKKLIGSLAEVGIRNEDFIYPYFIVEGKNVKEEIPSMPGVYHFSVDKLIEDMEGAMEVGIFSFLLFGTARKKDDQASDAYAGDGLTQQAVREIRKKLSGAVIYTDVCVCGFTTHGHCGMMKKKEEGVLDHYVSSDVLGKIAASHAEAGADFVAPSAMMDGQVKAIREALDMKGFTETGILAYSAKYQSSFYGPFRGALDSKPQFGDRSTYQMAVSNSREALREIEQDIEEGADMIMVKPALSYLDIIAKARERFPHPLVAYNVSGEYSFIKKAAEGDKEYEDALALESLISMKRAGADLIISYFAKDLMLRAFKELKK